jgi:hypothetical protein
MAIDAVRGAPQLFKITPGYKDAQIMRFFSPIPMWGRRRWDAVGEPVANGGGLFAYQFNRAELDEEIDFAKNALWLKEMTDPITD